MHLVTSLTYRFIIIFDDNFIDTILAIAATVLAPLIVYRLLARIALIRARWSALSLIIVESAIEH